VPKKVKSEFVPAPAVPRVPVPNAQAQEPQAGVVLGAEPAAVRGAGAVPRKPLAASGLPARLGAHRGSHELQLRGHVPAGAHRLVARSAAEPTQAAVADRAERQPSRLRKNSGLEPIWEEHQFTGAGNPLLLSFRTALAMRNLLRRVFQQPARTLNG